MMAEQQNPDTNTVGMPPSKKQKFSESDVLVGLLELPDELNDISDIGPAPFLGGPPNNTNDQQHLDLPSLNPPIPNNVMGGVTPPTINSISGTPPPPNIGVSPQLNSHMMGTPPPNATISTSGDPTPTLPTVSASPSHSVSSPMMAGGGNMSANMPPNPGNMYHQPHMPQGGGAMYNRMPHGNMTPPMDPRGYPSPINRHYNPLGHPPNPQMIPYMRHPQVTHPIQAPPPNNMVSDPGFPIHPQPNSFYGVPPRQPVMNPMPPDQTHHPQNSMGPGVPPPSGQPPPMGGIQPTASSASNDPEKRKLIQQQLVLLLHAHRCQQREREQQSHGTIRPCNLPHCRTMKNVLNHMTECQAGRDCSFPHCASSRQIIYHWKSCNQPECSVCLPLKSSRMGPVGGNVGPPDRVFPGNQASPMYNHPSPYSNPVYGGPNQPPPGAGGLKPDLRTTNVRNWHAEVNSDLRNHLIKKLVEAIYPMADQQQAMQDSRVASLYQYAVRVEKAMFESANDRNDYYQKLAERIYRIRKELDDKRISKRGLINGSVDDGSHPRIPSTPQSVPNSNAPIGSPLGDLSSQSSVPHPPTPLSESLKNDLVKSLMFNSPPPSSIPPSAADILNSITSKDNSVGGVAPPPTIQPEMMDIKIEAIDTSNIKQEPQERPNSVSTSAPHTPLDSVPSIKQQKSIRRESITDNPYSSQPTPLSSSLSSDAPISESVKAKPLNSRNIKPDPKLVKIFTADELEGALRPVFNAIWYQEPEALPFHKPVEPVLLGIPDYFDIIKNPIDLSSIDRKLRLGEYDNAWQFCDDVQLMFDNAWTYNKRTSRVYKFCSKLAEVFSENIDHAMVSLGYCCGQKYMFHPQVLYCYGKLCPIPRDSPYYGYHNNRYVYCAKCFLEMPGDNISINEDGSNPTLLPKTAFKEMKNDSVGLEPFVECIHCKRSFHKICVLHYEPLWPEGYQCNNCLKILNTIRKENKFIAKKLPTTKLGTFLEDRVNSFLRQAGAGTEVTIRVVSSSNKYLETRLGMSERFPTFPTQFPYRTKALFVFEEIDGTEVCFFGMHVQEYGSDCPTPNTRRVYISYLDSVHFFRPKQYRTLVYHEILIGYLDFCKQNGFQTAHIWACPPGEGDDYIFHCHPIEQKIPKPKRLVEWYRNMLERGREHNVISSYVDVFQYCTEVEITAVTEIPYFEGDFWPNVIEETIKELDQEAEERKAVEATVDNGSKKAGKRSTSKKGSKKAASRTKISRKVNPLVNGDDLTQKIYQTMDKHKEVFFVVYLQPPSLRSSPLPSTTDPDSLVTCDLMDGRDAFLNLAREKHWEFSSLRRAKYSTMSMLYELFNQGDRFVYTCNNCHTDVEFRYHCTECEDYDLCESCYKVVRHEHPMEKLGFNMGDVDSNSSSKNAPLTREQRNKKRNEFLIHACQCRDPSCSKPLCIKMKQLLRHARDCKMRLTGKCTACNFFIRTCALHAQECRETKCPVPICANLKQKIRERRLREKTRSMQTVKRRMAKMNQTTTSPPAQEEGTKPDPSPSTPQPIAAAPTPGKNVSSPNPNPNTPSQPAVPASPAPLTNPGTPFVPNTPQAKPVESPAPMPQQYNPQPQQQVDFNVQIQRIINALCSPSPQENLKAKEYLRGHPNIVPFVVSGLQKQNKEQEALYLRQEFAGILMARNNAAPVPGPAYRSRPPMPVHHQPPMMNHPGHYYPNQPPQRMMYAPGGGAGHSLHHMLQQQPPQRPMHQNPYGYGMPQGVHPNPPQYQMKPPSRTMMMYSHQNMMPPGQQQMNPAAAMMQQRPPMMNMHQGGVMGATPMRGLSMHQYRPPMEHQMVDPMMHYQYSGGPGNANNSNSNNNNISPSSGNPSSASISHQQYYISGKNFHHQM